MKISSNASTSVAAILGLSELDAYSDEMLASCVVKPDGHQKLIGMLGAERLWSVTTIARNAKFGGTRAVAICDSFGRAKEIVETNEGDIWEHSYMLAVIEGFDANHLYGGNEQLLFWYRWNIDSNCYEAIETPAPYEGVTGITVG